MCWLLSDGKKEWWERILCSIFWFLLWETAGQVVSQERHWLERSERGEPFAARGCLVVSQARRVSVLACTPPLAMVISYSTAHWRSVGLHHCPQRQCWPPQTWGVCNSAPAYWRQPRAGLPFFSFSFSGIGAEASAPVGSLRAPKNRQDWFVSVTLTLHAAWLSQPTGLPGRAASSSF